MGGLDTRASCLEFDYNLSGRKAVVAMIPVSHPAALSLPVRDIFWMANVIVSFRAFPCMLSSAFAS